MINAYRRTPLPQNAKTPISWVGFCFMCLIFSPFVGFAIHGKVAVAGLVTGLQFALLPLFALAVIVFLRWRSWQQLPPQIIEEWTSGRVVSPEGAPLLSSPTRFAHDKNWIEMQVEGVTIAKYNILSMQNVSQLLSKAWVSEQLGYLFVPWSDVIEWVVQTDSDGPDYFLIKLLPKGALTVRRFHPDGTTECNLLDGVRSIGKRPVRLLCDVDCE